MIEDIWPRLRHFTRNENWGDPDRMDADFLLQLDAFRGYVGHPFTLTTPAFAKTGHSSDSYHYKGRAVDGRFLRMGTREPFGLAECLYLAMIAPFGGIGIYTHSPNGVFFHFDNRDIHERRKVWVCERPGEYHNISDDHLKKYLQKPVILG